MIIDDVKTVLNISDASKDNLLNIYIRKAKTAVINYLNDSTLTADTVESTYPDALMELTLYYYRTADTQHMTQFQQGSRTETYINADSIPAFIKALLPVPYARMMGCYHDIQQSTTLI